MQFASSKPQAGRGASHALRSGLVALAALAAGWSIAHAQAPAPAAAPDTVSAVPSGKELSRQCLDCHNDEAKSKSADGKSLLVKGDDFRRSGHKKVECDECHGSDTLAAHLKDPKEKLGAVKPQVCQECHKDEFAAVATSIHGKRVAGAKAIKDCASCHGSMHRVNKEGDPDSPLSPTNQIKTCGECHEEVLANYEKSEHARALLKMGLTTAAPSCASCHGKHEVHPKDDPKSKTNAGNVNETCGACHTGVLRDFKGSAHGTPKDGKEFPTCAKCHEPHAVKAPENAATRTEVSDGCGNCHKEVYASFKDSFHGKATALANKQAAACADCHTAHNNLPASDPKSSIHPDNLAKTCGACHKNVNASFLTFDPHAKPSDAKRNPYVHWIWLGMTSLLIGVFAFFGLHGLLWLQRALVGKMRGEFAFGHSSPGPYVRRFSNMQMGVHVSIVTSFLVLAATGLPLKFAAAPWAPIVMGWMGGPVVAGILHRIAGVVTFGYFIWHLGMVAYDMFIKKERGFLWGPRSMVPQPKDIFDFIGMMKYFLYLGPRPKFDRFTYWEKFDYLAVFWGVAIIGCSGLVLWLPTLFTSFLPGWALNAAYVIHSDEALLATGFIFLFHFFHTHLRPEAFPLDPVVFVGCMPLERFKEERPLEYERMVAEGTLEQNLVPPPTPAAMRRAHLFGFTALTIGVALAVFIFAALLNGGLH